MYEQRFEKLSQNAFGNNFNNVNNLNNSNFLNVDKLTPNRNKSISVDTGFKNLNKSGLSSGQISESQLSSQNLKEKKDINIEFFDLKNQKSSFQLQSSCLWKIEGHNNQRGGVVQWDNSYRLRHFTSGKYLRVHEKKDEHQTEKYTLELSNKIDEYTLFSFVPFENLLQTSDYQKYISKDAFLKIQNTLTGLWITFNEDSENNNSSSLPVSLTHLGF